MAWIALSSKRAMSCSRALSRLPVAFHRMRGHGDDGDVRVLLTFNCANRRRGLESIHFRHLHIHQDHIKMVRTKHVHGAQTILRDANFMPSLLQ